ncbi:MAG: site-2 protease family protein [Anaerolineae bacterium]|jgi:Zn-dependent protease|nr:site-2 protease family protein [Anaerolineae bacterium]
MLGLNIKEILYRLIILLIAFSVHEFAHAFIADRFGDNTPRQNGRLTLNPAAHIDPIGALVLLFAGFGWAKPVPINPYALRQRSKSAVMWVSLAGPLSNVLLALFGSVVFVVLWNVAGITLPTATGLSQTLLEFFQYFISINIALAVFNMIPIFPLDGEKVLDYLLPPGGKDFLASIRPYSSYILLTVVFLLPMMGFSLFGVIFNPIINSWFSLIASVLA